jgi:hypothetical protein
LPGAKNIKRTAWLELRYCQLEPAVRPVEEGFARTHVRVVAVILAQTVRRIGHDQVDRAVREIRCIGQEIAVMQVDTALDAPWIVFVDVIGGAVRIA